MPGLLFPNPPPHPTPTQIKVPAWAEYVKTATYKELGPLDNDWFYVRIAAVARRVYLRQGLGTGRLRESFGGASNNGARPEHHARASGNIIRKSLQALEKLGLVEKLPTGGEHVVEPPSSRLVPSFRGFHAELPPSGHAAGRAMTANGRRQLDMIAGRAQ